MVDLDLLEKRLTSAASGIFDRPRDTQEKGLAGLVDIYLGKPLDKRDQISNWEKRPLSQNQVLYAANDAFILLKLYDALRELAVSSEALAKFDLIVKDLIKTKNKVEKKKMSQSEREKMRQLNKEQLKRELKNYAG